MDDTGGQRSERWRLRARQSTAVCVVQPVNIGAVLLLLQDDEVIIREQFADPHLADLRAEALRVRLQEKGWHAVAAAAP